MEIGLTTYGNTMWRLAREKETFRVTLVGANKEYFNDPTLTDEGKTLGQCHREMLHQRLDEFIDAYIETGDGSSIL